MLWEALCIRSNPWQICLIWVGKGPLTILPRSESPKKSALTAMPCLTRLSFQSIMVMINIFLFHFFSAAPSFQEADECVEANAPPVWARCLLQFSRGSGISHCSTSPVKVAIRKRVHLHHLVQVGAHHKAKYSPVVWYSQVVWDWLTNLENISTAFGSSCQKSLPCFFYD